MLSQRKSEHVVSPQTVNEGAVSQRAGRSAEGGFAGVP